MTKLETTTEITEYLKELARIAKIRGEAQQWKTNADEINFLLGGMVALRFIDHMDMIPPSMSIAYMCNATETYSAIGLTEQYEFFKNKNKKKKKTAKKKNKTKD